MQTSRTDRGLRIAIGVLLATFVYVIFVSIHERMVGVGDDAPTFSIAADNGRTISLKDFGGKLLVLNFWATWCAPCIEEIPSLDQFQRELAGSGVVVLGVSVDQDEKAYRQFLSRAKVSFLTARDPDRKINADYGTFRYPETYIINSSGNVVMKIVSNTEWAAQRMVTYVRSLLSPTS